MANEPFRLPDLRDDAHSALHRAADRIVLVLDRLRTIDPFILDNSIRESATSAPLGHTLADKQRLLVLVRELGITETIIANFNERETVDDAFARALREQGDHAGLHAFAMLGEVAEGRFTPSVSTLKLLDYRVPNAVLNANIGRARRAHGPDDGTRLAEIEASVDHLRPRLPGRLLLNLQDLHDALDDTPGYVAEALALAARLPIDGVMFEDARGTRLPAQAAALVELVRAFVPPPRLLLVHPHAGNGLEHASVIEALLAGADGTWIGLLPEAAYIGHAASLVLLTNLARAGNPHVARRFRLDRLALVAAEMHAIHRGEALPTGLPVVGRDAYRATLAAFEQGGYPGDLPAAMVGQVAGARVVPAIAAGEIFARRLVELGVAPDRAAPPALHARMRAIIDEHLLAGHKVAWDEPTHLLRLLAMAEASATP